MTIGSQKYIGGGGGGAVSKIEQLSEDMFLYFFLVSNVE